MGLTPNSNSNPYCTGSQYVQFCDAIRTGQLIGTNGVPIPPGNVPTNAVLFTLLQAASGEVEAACGEAGRYAPSDLLNIAATTTNSAIMLARIVAGLTFGLAHEIRGYQIPKDLTSVTNARTALESLRNGSAILSFLETEEAGLAETSNYSPSEIFALDRVSDRAIRFFGRRIDGSGDFGLGYGDYRAGDG